MGTFATRFMARLENGLGQRGFSVVTKRLIDNKLRSAGFIPKERTVGIVEHGESIFTRSGKGSGKSNFFVFAKVISEDRVITLLSNPDQGEHANKLLRNQFLIRRDYHEGDPERGAEAVIGEAIALSQKKEEGEYYAQIHFHHGYPGKIEFDMNGNPHLVHAMDDGESMLSDIIRKAVLYHMDVLAMSPHNNVDIYTYKLMQMICEELGIVCIPATEVTAPIEKHNPNGPHLLLLLANETAIKAANMMILSKRDPELQMISLSLGITMDRILEKIRELVKRKLAVFGIAHPFNYNSSALPIKAVGLVSAMDRGVLTWNEVDSILREAHFIGGVNPTLNAGEVPLRNNALRAKLLELQRRHGLGRIITAHNVATALGREYGKSSFDGDDHKTTSTGNPHPGFGVNDTYVCGGDISAMGHTSVTFDAPTQNAVMALGRKPTPEEIIRWFIEGSAKLEEKAFVRMQNCRLVIAPERLERPSSRKKEHVDMGERQETGYVRALMHDSAYFLRNIMLKELENLPGK